MARTKATARDAAKDMGMPSPPKRLRSSKAPAPARGASGADRSGEGADDELEGIDEDEGGPPITGEAMAQLLNNGNVNVYSAERRGGNLFFAIAKVRRLCQPPPCSYALHAGC